MATERVPMTLRIMPKVKKEAKKTALELDMTLGEFVETAILHQIRKVRK